jgi:SAM-dependent methyltransferase
MRSSVVTTYLRCPVCRSDVDAAAAVVRCSRGHSFPFAENVVDFSAVTQVEPRQERTKRSFGIEWTQYYPALGWAISEGAEEVDYFLIATKAIPSFFSDKIVIDAGCGNGRYINILNTISVPPPRVVIGVDLSDSIVQAARNCARFSNVLFLKIDLNLLPDVIKDPVDYVYSLGVLHYTPDAERGFYSLARCVKNGGFLSLALYGRGNRILYNVNCFLRNRFFQKWPPALVYWLCVLVAIPAQVFRIKYFGYLMKDLVCRFIFVSPNVHNMFNAYSNGYTSFHERSEVERWYRKVGFDCAVEEYDNRTSLYCIGQRVSLPARAQTPRIEADECAVS